VNRYAAVGRGPDVLAGLAARHQLIQLAGVGHAAGDVLAAPQVRELVFGQP
jgi:hypothetical protein